METEGKIVITIFIIIICICCFCFYFSSNSQHQGKSEQCMKYENFPNIHCDDDDVWQHQLIGLANQSRHNNYRVKSGITD